MAYESLREWIAALQKAGELKRITAEVSPILEMAEIADRASKLGKGTDRAGGPALLFENVIGYKGAQVLMNQFGSERRMRLALEVDSLDDIARRIETLLRPTIPTGILDGRCVHVAGQPFQFSDVGRRPIVSGQFLIDVGRRQ